MDQALIAEGGLQIKDQRLGFLILYDWQEPQYLCFLRSFFADCQGYKCQSFCFSGEPKN